MKDALSKKYTKIVFFSAFFAFYFCWMYGKWVSILFWNVKHRPFLSVLSLFEKPPKKYFNTWKSTQVNNLNSLNYVQEVNELLSIHRADTDGNSVPTWLISSSWPLLETRWSKKNQVVAKGITPANSTYACTVTVHYL